jgi:putative spermidine/putrescine transport system ATP-binding protein
MMGFSGKLRPGSGRAGSGRSGSGRAGSGRAGDGPARSSEREGQALVLDRLCRSFGQATALDGFSLDLAPGELMVLLGPSGCGKTTALRIVAGFETCDSGRVLLEGVDISGVPANRRDMGMVFQSYSLFPHLTAEQNVAFGLRLRGWDGQARRARTGELLELVGLQREARRFPHQMSGGQQQRVALARALAIEPQVLLLDEPLSALDAKVRDALRDEIRNLQRRLRITTIFVTHDRPGVRDAQRSRRAGRTA